MAMTIKQVIVGTAIGTIIVGVAAVRLRKEKIARERPTEVASLKTPAVHKKHLRTSDMEVSSRKLVG